MTNPRFDEVRREAAAALAGADGDASDADAPDLRSLYVGLVHEDGRHEYYFGNDTGEAAELREAAAVQLGMLLRVLADRSDRDVDEVADLARERAAAMELR